MAGEVIIVTRAGSNSVVTSNVNASGAVNSSVAQGSNPTSTINNPSTIESQVSGAAGPQGLPGLVQAIVAGDNIDVDATDPANPIVAVEALTKSDVGLGNVDNTSDANKPVSTAQAAAIAVVQSDINTHEANTSNPHSVTKSQVGLGSVDNVQQQPLDSDLTTIAALTPTDGDMIQRVSGSWLNRTMAQVKTALSLVKGDVGLGNVDNTSDADKPVSTAQQTALDGKQNIDQDLTDISALTPSNDDIMQRKAGAWTNRTLAQILSDLAGVGTTFQPLDSDLTAIAGLTATTDNFMVATASAWASRTPSQARTQMGLGGLAVLSAVTEAEISLSDNTTNDFSITKHGFVPKGTNTGKFLKDDGTWTSIPGGGDMLAATYDPQAIGADAFDVDNHTDGTTNKVFTAVEESKLAGIETGADVTDATNVAAAGATMDADTSLAGNGYFLDEDNMASDSATKVPSQQSVKAYADTKQPLDSDLTTLAGLTATTDNFIQSKSSAWASRTPAQVAADLAVEIGKLLYPVGSVVTFGVSTNPATLLGFGTWAAIAGRVIVGLDSGQTEFDTLDETGGAKTHTLTGAQSGTSVHSHGITDPGHTHTSPTSDGSNNTASGTVNRAQNTDGVTGSNTTGITVNNSSAADASQAHNNLQPYIVKYVWQRTA